MLIISSVSPYLTTVTSGYWISEDKLFLFHLWSIFNSNTYKKNDFKTTVFLNLEINHFIFEKIYLCRSSCSEAQVYFYYNSELRTQNYLLDNKTIPYIRLMNSHGFYVNTYIFFKLQGFLCQEITTKDE